MNNIISMYEPVSFLAGIAFAACLSLATSYLAHKMVDCQLCDWDHVALEIWRAKYEAKRLVCRARRALTGLSR